MEPRIVAVALPCDKNVVAELALLLIGGKVEKLKSEKVI